MSFKHPCIDCGAPTDRTRCRRCQRTYVNTVRGTPAMRGYDEAWRALSRAVLREWRAQHGDWCPGWQCPPHASSDLTVDHVTPIHVAGMSVPTKEGCSVLCRRCNSRKGARQYPDPPPVTPRATTRQATRRRSPSQQVWVR